MKQKLGTYPENWVLPESMIIGADQKEWSLRG